MGFLKNKKEHECNVPEMEELDFGTRWQCDTCKQIWTVIKFKSNVGDKAWINEDLSEELEHLKYE
jgi:hypothetical protein